MVGFWAPLKGLFKTTTWSLPFQKGSYKSYSVKHFAYNSVVFTLSPKIPN